MWKEQARALLYVLYDEEYDLQSHIRRLEEALDTDDEAAFETVRKEIDQAE